MDLYHSRHDQKDFLLWWIVVNVETLMLVFRLLVIPNCEFYQWDVCINTLCLPKLGKHCKRGSGKTMGAGVWSGEGCQMSSSGQGMIIYTWIHWSCGFRIFTRSRQWMIQEEFSDPYPLLRCYWKLLAIRRNRTTLVLPHRLIVYAPGTIQPWTYEHYCLESEDCKNTL